jgi:hypothetical protein
MKASQKTSAQISKINFAETEKQRNHRDNRKKIRFVKTKDAGIV